MGVELYNRRAALTVAPITGEEGIKIEGLRIAFEIEKTSTSEANKGTIRIYNLAEQTRDWLQAKDQAIVLEAGYLELVQRLFAGVIDRLEHKREGVNMVTEIECKDGGLDLRDPEFHRSYPAGSSKTAIIRDIIAAMPHTDQGALIAAGISGTTPGKLSLSGGCKRVLDRLARSWDFEWSIQDGALQVLEEGEALTPSALAIVLTPDTGLLGVPTKTDRGAKFSSLLLPSIKPGTYVSIESEFLTGSYKADSMRHVGDTHGNDWNTETEGRRLT